MDDDTKPVYLLGYREGLMIAFMSSLYGGVRQKLVSQMQGRFPDGLSYPEIRSAVDRFYEIPENAPIQIGFALQVVQMRTAGVESTKIDEFVSSIRHEASKMSSPGEEPH